MAYCTVQDLFAFVPEDKVRQWVNPTGDLTAEEELTELASVVAWSAVEMDGYISSGGHAVPVSPAPGILGLINAHLALCLLLDKIGYEPSGADANIAAKCKDYREFLTHISTGSQPLPQVEGATPPLAAKVIKAVALGRV